MSGGATKNHTAGYNVVQGGAGGAGGAGGKGSGNSNSLVLTNVLMLSTTFFTAAIVSGNAVTFSKIFLHCPIILNDVKSGIIFHLPDVSFSQPGRKSKTD